MTEILLIYFIYALFLRDPPTDQMRRRIFAQDGSNDADSRKDVSFLGFVDTAPHLGGGQNPQNPDFWGVNRRFEAKLVKSKNMHGTKTTASIPTKFCTVIKTTNGRTHNESMMADGRHLGKIENSPYLCRDLTDLDQIWHGSAARPSSTVRLLKMYFKFQKSKMAAAAILKKMNNRHISAVV